MKPLSRFNLVFSFDESGMRMSKDQILILSVVMTFSALLGFMAWLTFTGNLTPLGFAMTWTFRILGPLGFIGGAALYFKLKYRRDLAPHLPWFHLHPLLWSKWLVFRVHSDDR